MKLLQYGIELIICKENRKVDASYGEYKTYEGEWRGSEINLR